MMKLPSSSDPVIDALAQKISGCQGSLLWLAEEQIVSPDLGKALARDATLYLSNRWEQVEAVRRLGIAADYHDFELSRLQGRRFDQLALRVPKQRALVHHLLNQASAVLSPGGTLWLAGFKGEGIKTHAQRAAQRLGGSASRIRTAGGVGLFEVRCGDQAGLQLDDQSYPQLRELNLEAEGKFWTKPGIYGWDKVDQGSRFLVDILRQTYANLAGRSVLDLGCGYGYLAVQAARLQPRRLVATDNQAAAVLAASRNLAQTGLDTQVTADDCGGQLQETFDLILCNPPFHQGFATTSELHSRFVTAIGRLLAPGGRALLVINAFLRLDDLCARQGLTCVEQQTASGGDFRVLGLERAGQRG